MSRDIAASEQRYNNLLSVIKDRLVPDSVAKAERGEVFTPLELVREMLFGIRKDKAEKGEIEVFGLDKSGNFIDEDDTNRIGGLPVEGIWNNPNLKWLDPANGIGNFPVVAFYKLDYELAKLSDYKDKEKRRRHIVEKMLFMVELDKENCATAKSKIFKNLCPGAKPNIYCADTLGLSKKELEDEFGASSFDIIMGNPPFNSGGVKHHSDRGFFAKFIVFALDHLEKNGYLVYVHPPNFHRIKKHHDDKKGIYIKDLFNEKNLLFLRIMDTYYVKQHFEVQIALDYYVLQNRDNEGKTTVFDKNNIVSIINFKDYETVPNFGFPLINKLLQLREKNGEFKAKYGRDSANHLTTKKAFYRNGKYKIVHLINKNGLRVYLSSKPHPYQSKPKIIINGLGEPYVFYDSEGKYGVTQIPIYVLEPSRKEREFLLSSVFHYLLWAFRIQGNNNDMFVFEILPDINKGVDLDKFKAEVKDYSPLEFDKKEKIESVALGTLKAERSASLRKTRRAN